MTISRQTMSGASSQVGGKAFLKWAGGKARSAYALARLEPPGMGCYWEPFLGSAATFFELAPQSAVLSDTNPELVICFQQVRDNPDEVMEHLDGMPNTKDYFQLVRRQDVTALSEIERAARVIYLNKTSFRGLWRVNRNGEYNVPYGAYSRPYYNRQTILTAARQLAGVRIECMDFSEAFRRAAPGDWIYADPPYVPETVWGDFKRYTADQFNEPDHARLAQLMHDATARGVYVMVTNSDMPPVREMFHGFAFAHLPTRRDIHLDPAKRVSKDLVITNYVEFRAQPQPLEPPGLAQRLVTSPS